MEKFRGYRGDKRCRRCNWFGHMAYQCRREEIKAEKEQRGESKENRWKPLRCRVMAYEEERRAAHSERRKVQQVMKCWGCGEEGHCLWTCPKKAVRPVRREAQQQKLRCAGYGEENHVARNCDGYWRWREQELRKKVKELKEMKEKAKKKKKVVRRTM